MKTITILSLFLSTVSAHAIFQRVSVNGVDQGLLNGVRSPSTNNPVQDVLSQALTCNTGLQTPVSTSTIQIPAGAKVGALYQHLIGGPQGSNDPDNPIAASHKGPIIVYLAKVTNAGTAATTGLSWFKIAEEGFNTATTKWAVDTMIAGNGWWYFTFPSCIAPGQYLMRVELIALHSAYTTGQAQFYPACANIEVTGQGTFVPGSTVGIPGVYSASDPSIKINIYGSSGTANNNNQPYKIPGPAVITCPSGPQPTTSAQPTTTASRTTTLVTTTSTRTSTAVSQTTSPRTSSTTTTVRTSSTTTATASATAGVGAPLWGQCGGGSWAGPFTCAQGKCVVQSEWYYQCTP